MKGAYKGKVRGTQDKPAGKDLHRVEHVKDNMREEGQHGGDSTTGTGCMGLEAISKQIGEFKSELKQDLKMFKEEIEHDTREEFHEFKQDVNQQLATYMHAIKEQKRENHQDGDPDR